MIELQEKLQDTEQTMLGLRQIMAERPEDEALLINFQSLEQRFSDLQEEYAEVAGTLGLDVCSYRLFADPTHTTLRGMVDTLGAFQSLFTLTYDAIKSGPKRIARVDSESAHQSAFSFGYSFTGSLGIVLTMPKELILLPGIAGSLDNAIQVVLSLVRADDSETVLGYARDLGPAPIRALYRWADAHVRSGLGAEIEWRRSTELRARALLQTPELQRLQGVLGATSEIDEEVIEVTAQLVGANVQARTFHLRSPEVEIRGRFIDAIDPEHTVELPKTYHAQIRRTTKTYFSTEEEETTYVLLALRPV
jgi:hypothetical protein